MDAFELNLVFPGNGCVWISLWICVCALPPPPTLVSAPSSSSHPALDTLRRNPFSEGQRPFAASGLYYIHSFVATIFKCIKSKYGSENALNRRGWPGGAPARSSSLKSRAKCVLLGAGAFSTQFAGLQPQYRKPAAALGSPEGD